MTVAWDSDLVTGVEGIDHEHREILSLIDQLLPRTDGEPFAMQRSLEMLKRLEVYLVAHISHEERWMTASHYPGAVPHVTDHSRLTAQVSALRLRVEVGSIEPRRFLQAVRSLAHDVTSHVDTFDRYLSRFMRSRGNA